MATLLLVRHGRTTANASGVLAGRTSGVELDERGREQGRGLGARLRGLPLAAVVSSPLERCVQTAELLLDGREPVLEPVLDDRFVECGYGEWTGRELKRLAKEPLWRQVQAHPSAVRFPGEEGESMLGMQARAVAAVREWDARIGAHHGPDAIWVAVSHGDVVKSIVADALGLHLDLFQRIAVDPASVTVLRYTELRPFVLRTNDVGGDLSGLRPPRKRRRRTPSSDADIGGGAG